MVCGFALGTSGGLLCQLSDDDGLVGGLGSDSTSKSVLVDTVADRLVRRGWQVGAGEERTVDRWAFCGDLRLRRLGRRVAVGTVVLGGQAVKVTRGLDTDIISRQSKARRPLHSRAAIAREGDHAVAVIGWEVRKGDTTREDIGDGLGEEGIHLGPQSRRGEDTATN